MCLHDIERRNIEGYKYIIQLKSLCTLGYIEQHKGKVHSPVFEIPQDRLVSGESGIEFREAVPLWLVGVAARTRNWAGWLGVLLPACLSEVLGEHSSVVH